MKQSTFELFRYQLLPTSREIQMHMYEDVRSVEDVERRKNEFFEEALSKFPAIKHRQMELLQKELFHKENVYCFKLGSQKTIEINTEDFHKRKVTDVPNVTVIINNDPDVQKIAVSRNIRAFSSSRVVADLPPQNRSNLMLRLWDRIDKEEAHAQKELSSRRNYHQAA